MKRKGTAATGSLAICVLVAALLLLLQPGNTGAEQQFFRMGDSRLEGGGVIVIASSVIAHSEKLDGSGSIAVVFPSCLWGHRPISRPSLFRESSSTPPPSIRQRR
jgi:hypothetical protein